MSPAGGQKGNVSSEKLFEAFNRSHENILIADDDYNLIFMNNAAYQTMQAMADLMRQKYRIDAENMVGESIDRFHPGTLAKRVRTILGDSTNFPYKTTIAIGTKKIAMQVEKYSQGAFSGFKVIWQDTVQL